MVNNKADVNIRNNAKNTPLQEVENVQKAEKNILIFNDSNISKKIERILEYANKEQEYKFIRKLLTSSPVKSRTCLIL